MGRDQGRRSVGQLGATSGGAGVAQRALNPSDGPVESTTTTGPHRGPAIGRQTQTCHSPCGAACTSDYEASGGRCPARVAPRRLPRRYGRFRAPARACVRTLTRRHGDEQGSGLAARPQTPYDRTAPTVADAEGGRFRDPPGRGSTPADPDPSTSAGRRRRPLQGSTRWGIHSRGSRSLHQRRTPKAAASGIHAVGGSTPADPDPSTSAGRRRRPLQGSTRWGIRSCGSPTCGPATAPSGTGRAPTGRPACGTRPTRCA